MGSRQKGELRVRIWFDAHQYISLSVVFIIFASAHVHAASNDSKPYIKMAGSLDKAWVNQKQIYLAGTVVGADVKSVAIKGVAVAGKGVIVENGGFGAIVILNNGENIVQVLAGKLKSILKIYYGEEEIKPPKGYKRYFIHPGVKELNCRECHKFRRGKYDFKHNVPAQSNCTAKKCHGNEMATEQYVHGPVGAGVCISCHNPHGSYREKHLEHDDGELCMVCHEARKEEFDRKVIHAPVEDGCSECHDPHQSPLKFQLKGEKGKPVSSLCYNCHDQTIFSKKFQHGPVGAGDCIACHNAHTSNNEKLLVVEKTNGEVCFQCHADSRDSFNLKQIHQPVKDDCGHCHDPHSSGFKMQLVKQQNVLCEGCHKHTNPKLFQEIASAKHKHEPVADGRCVDCHRAHSSNYTPLLADSMEKLCFQCHLDLGEEIAGSTFLHGPVKTGDCTACHSMIHGSSHAKLLGREFPMNFYDAYNPTKYDLCFGCHNKDIAKRKNTTELTNFRDGQFNLHFLHVNRKKGRTCTSCHGAHASNQEKHVREEVPYGGWFYPIQFTKTESGGTCVVGCHAPKTYDRVKPLLKIGS